MSVLSHNVSPRKWWQCSHPLVVYIDLFGAFVSIIALFYVDGMYARLYVLVVIVQMFVSALYHWRYTSKLFQYVDHAFIYILIAATAMPYMHFHIIDGELWLFQLLMIVTIAAIVIKRLHIHLDHVSNLLYSIVTAFVAYIMLGLGQHVDTYSAAAFWVGAWLYPFQMFLYIWRYNNWYRERQHLFGQLPATQIHVWLVAYLF